MNDVEQNIGRLLNLLVSTPTLADQLVEHFDQTIQAVDIEISRDEMQMFLKGSLAHPTNRHVILANEVTISSTCTLPGGYPSPFTIFTKIFTRN